MFVANTLRNCRQIYLVEYYLDYLDNNQIEKWEDKSIRRPIKEKFGEIEISIL